jgi:hypothetical protein
MKRNKIEQTNEETQSITNGDGINDGIYSPSFENKFINDLYDKQYGILEHTGYLQHFIDRWKKAEKNLRTIEKQIIGSIGNDSYKDIMDLIYWEQEWLEQDIEDEWKEYDELNQFLSHAEK